MKNIFQSNKIIIAIVLILALPIVFGLYKLMTYNVEQTIHTVLKVDADENDIVHMNSEDVYKVKVGDKINTKINNKNLHGNIRSIEYNGDNDFEVSLNFDDNQLLPGTIIPINITYKKEPFYKVLIS